MNRFPLPLPSLAVLLLSASALLAGCHNERTVTITESATRYELVARYPEASYSQLARAARISLASLPVGEKAPLVQLAPGQLRVAFAKPTTAPATAHCIRQFARTVTTLLTAPQP